MPILQITQKIDRASLMLSLFSPMSHPVHVQVETGSPVDTIEVKVQKVEMEDGSGYLFNVEGLTARSGTSVRMFVNCDPGVHSCGCIS